jgi:hypothetical protein
MRNNYRIVCLMIPVLFGIFLLSCSGGDKSKEQKSASDSIDSLKAVADSIAWAQKSFPKSLIIKGTNVNMRVSPDLKAVRIKQLTTNDSCEVLEKGKLMTIDDQKDYWYRVKFKNKEGWVFGAFTSIKLVEKPESPKRFTPIKK